MEGENSIVTRSSQIGLLSLPDFWMTPQLFYFMFGYRTTGDARMVTSIEESHQSPPSTQWWGANGPVPLMRKFSHKTGHILFKSSQYLPVFGPKQSLFLPLSPQRVLADWLTLSCWLKTIQTEAFSEMALREFSAAL